MARYQRLRISGKSVVIDGLCASVCTIVLAELPHGRICVSQEAAPRLPRGLGLRPPQLARDQSVRDLDVVRVLSGAGAALDSQTRRPDPEDQVPRRSVATHAVPALQPSFDRARTLNDIEAFQ
jgi:hypothetical protein